MVSLLVPHNHSIYPFLPYPGGHDSPHAELWSALRRQEWVPAGALLQALGQVLGPVQEPAQRLDEEQR